MALVLKDGTIVDVLRLPTKHYLLDPPEKIFELNEDTPEIKQLMKDFTNMNIANTSSFTFKTGEGPHDKVYSVHRLVEYCLMNIHQYKWMDKEQYINFTKVPREVDESKKDQLVMVSTHNLFSPLSMTGSDLTQVRGQNPLAVTLATGQMDLVQQLTVSRNLFGNLLYSKDFYGRKADRTQLYNQQMQVQNVLVLLMEFFQDYANATNQSDRGFYVLPDAHVQSTAFDSINRVAYFI